jgi:hypothetical protein
MERTRSLIEGALEKIFIARELREVSRELRYNNSDFREFLFENRQAVHSQYQRWLERRTSSAHSPSERLP